MYKKLQKLQIQKEENGREKKQNRLATNNRTTRPYNRADALRELQSHSSQPAQIQKKAIGPNQKLKTGRCANQAAHNRL